MRLITLTTIVATLTASVILGSTRTARGDQYARADGRRFDAQVLEASATQGTVTLRNGKDQVLGASELSQASHYAALAGHLAPASPAERLALARTCLEAKLFAPARAEAKRAALDEPAVAVDAAAISSAADERQARDLLARGLEQMAGGDERGTHLLLQVLNRFPNSGALPAAAVGLRDWTAGMLPAIAPKDGPAAKGKGGGAISPALRGADAAIARAKSARTSGLKTPVNRGDKRLRYFRTAETELEGARRWVVGVKRSKRAPVATCDAKLREIKHAFLDLATAAGGALLDSGRPSDARRFIYNGLSIEPGHQPLQDLQARLAAALLNDPDASGMSLAELARRVGRGTATQEMLRIYQRRLAQRGINPRPSGPVIPQPVIPDRQGETPPPTPLPTPGPAPSPQRPNGG